MGTIAPAPISGVVVTRPHCDHVFTQRELHEEKGDTYDTIYIVHSEVCSDCDAVVSQFREKRSV